MMSPRRPILAFALASLILAGLGLRDWPVDGGRAMIFADRALTDFGVALTAEGPAKLRLLPLPRLALGGVRIAAGPAGPALAEADRLVVEFDPRGLLAGRATIGGLRVEGARLSPDAGAWSQPLARLAQRVRSGATERPRWIALTGARFAGGGDAGDIEVELDWPFWSASAEARASLTWRGVPARIALTHLRPTDIAQGRRSPFTAQMTWPGGSLAADGTAAMPEGAGLPALAGQARFETRSLPETLAWIGRDAPLSLLAGAFSLAGSFETADRSVSWPSLRVGLGDNVLEGAGAVTLVSGTATRLSVQATLAAETLNLAPLMGDLARLLDPEPTPLALAPLTGGDLDLRLSAAEGQIGPVQVQDLAASVLVRDAAIEIALNRARLQDGTLKARLTLESGADPADTEMRVQGSLDRVDLGSLLGEFGTARWMVGPLQGQFSLESNARDSAGLLAHLGGRASLAVEGGAIAGLDLADVVHRNGAIAAGALARRNGRTAFDRAAVTLRFSDGIGEIAECGLRGPSVGATLYGQVSLPERRLRARGDLTLRVPADPSRGLLFEVSGPWDALNAQTLPRGEGAELPSRSGETMLSDPLKLPAALGLTGNARAYAP
ncbi:AsmA-like C-terminal region-containing protein [Methylobacterium sp. NEAU K]|uniref:AsmA family protein n=1 Tax=Methylobacterium sp. NEAU K TaxID=3064946 RepID=UPI0027325E0C|nr:AsmA-like C-terminal region-containing protein [Methylobacterium sp. NEAU K]MDP4002019.1 AsmA-like C-terminal region-containing protein [Methylobacterium sp. NEAU K]